MKNDLRRNSDIHNLQIICSISVDVILRKGSVNFTLTGHCKHVHIVAGFKHFDISYSSLFKFCYVSLHICVAAFQPLGITMELYNVKYVSVIIPLPQF